MDTYEFTNFTKKEYYTVQVRKINSTYDWEEEYSKEDAIRIASRIAKEGLYKTKHDARIVKKLVTIQTFVEDEFISVYENKDVL